jgi:hypothetical protein
MKLGNPNGAPGLRKQVGNKEALCAITLEAQARTNNIRSIAHDIRAVLHLKRRTESALW